MSFTLNHPLDKIINAIQRKGGRLTLTEIKRSIALFNQSGGVDKLRQCLADLVSKGILTIEPDEAGKDQLYSTAPDIASNLSNNSNNPGNEGITLTFTVGIRDRGLLDALQSFLQPDAADDAEPAVPDDDPDQFLPDDLINDDPSGNEESDTDEDSEVPF